MNRKLNRQPVPSFPAWPTAYRIDEWRRGAQENINGWALNLARYLTQQFGDIIEQVNSQTQGRGADLVAAATIKVTNPIHRVSGSATIKTIVPPDSKTGVEADQVTPRMLSSFTGPVYLIPTAGSTWSVDATGNIMKAASAVVGQQMILTYDGEKWAPAS